MTRWNTPRILDPYLGPWVGTTTSILTKNGYSCLPTAREPSLDVGGLSDEERSELSYADYEDQHPTDRSTPDNPGTTRTTPHNRRSPYVAISSREHSSYQARRCGSDETLVGLLSAIDALQHLSNCVGDPHDCLLTL